jgi:hypothetical protein
MDKYDINDILSAVGNLNNDGDNMNDIMANLKQRIPNIITSIQNSSHKHSDVILDDVSVSSSPSPYDRSEQSLKNTHANTHANTQVNPQAQIRTPGQNQVSFNHTPIIHELSPQEPKHEPKTILKTRQNTSHINKEDVKADAKADVKADAKADVKADAKADVKADAKADAKAGTNESTIIVENSHLTSIMGYNIPTSTLYFIIVLVAIAVGLYFMTTDRKKDKEKDKNKIKEKKSD